MTDDELKLFKERLDWIEKIGTENMKLHHVSADNLAKDSATTLTVLLAGLGGSLAYAAKAFDEWSSLSAGASALTVWLSVLSFYLVKKCLMTTAIPQVYNEPRNFLDKNYTIHELREAELVNLQVRIDDAAKRNANLAKHLNRVRRLAIASPVVFATGICLYLAAKACWG